jgi:hypothetical protein
MTTQADRTARHQVSVVLPCLDEAGSVQDVVRLAGATMARAGIDGEVVVADNGSSDGSRGLAAAAGARVVDVPIRGYGAALAGGIAAADGEICVMADADATYPLEELPRLIAPIVADDADMVVGSRLASAAAHAMPAMHRYLGTPVITWLVRRAGGPSGLSDSQSGFRAFRRDRLVSLGLSSPGMEYASEMLIVASRDGWRIREIETGYRERVGESKLDAFSDGVRHLSTILLLAPDLAAILPGMLLIGLGGLALLWALIDPSVRTAGSAAWVASFLAVAMLLLGTQFLLLGLVLAARSPVAAHRTRFQSAAVLRAALIAGTWAIGAGLIILLALIAVAVAGFAPPARAPQIEILGIVLVVLGGGAVGSSFVLNFAVADSRRIAAAPERVASPIPAEPASDAEGVAGAAVASSTGAPTSTADIISA